MKVLYSGKYLRGFHKQLFNHPPRGITYVSERDDASSDLFFERKGVLRNTAAKLWSSRLGSILGLIEYRDFTGFDQVDMIQTYNRFIKTGGTPYVIYLENPTALYHYKLHRMHSYVSMNKLKKYARDTSLSSIVCLSNACKESLPKVAPFIPSELPVRTIYPFVEQNPHISESRIASKAQTKELKLLHISSDFMMKGGPEILKALKSLDNTDLKLIIVTPPATIPRKFKKKIEATPNIALIPFNLSTDQLSKLYAESHVLLHPTLKDSFALVVLEALKAGLPVIGTDLYAISEMVSEKNGFLIEPPLRYFNKDLTPNNELWGKNELLQDRTTFPELATFLAEKIQLLYEDRGLLVDLSTASLRKSLAAPFSCEYIHQQWKEVYQAKP